jgi:hypothetical protein
VHAALGYYAATSAKVKQITAPQATGALKANPRSFHSARCK